jgi:MoxR-like ATPase
MIEVRAMQEKMKFSSGEVSRYVANRLRQGPDHTKVEKKPKARKSRAQGGGRLQAIELERVLGELDRMELERQDLLRQIVSDQRLLDAGNRSTTQDEVLAMLDDSEGMEDLNMRSFTGNVSLSQGLESSIRAARSRLAEIRTKIGELMDDDRVAQAYQERVEAKVKTIRLARNVESLQGLIEKCDLAQMQLVARRSSEDVTLTEADRETMGKYDLIRQKAREKIDALMGREDVYYETRRRGLLEFRRQLMNGGFVRTASIRSEIMRILSHLQLGIPVFLRGHLGVGKTEIALHVSRKYLGHEPEFISGSEEATKYDIYGRTQIGVNSERNKLQEFKRRMDEYRALNPDAGPKELKEVERQYYETIVVKGQATSFFQYGPLVRAMKEGKPLIIDEMDGIPHSIIMRINHALTRKAGDRIRIQENGGEEITVKKGFCVIATGNVKSARYKREELDAAFLSRWWSEDIKYPPQTETYEILMAALIDRRGNLQVKNPVDLEDIRRLTEAATEIQQIFSGDHLDFLGEGADAARGTPAGLKKTVLSLRHLWNIVRPWKANNFDKPVEHYILNEFIRPAVAEDQVYLVQLFCRFRFFKTWTVEQFEVPGLTEAKLLAFQGKQAF